ncbi:MAG: PAS domain S-box protein [Streptosporangiales bacterium]|nr:PAS domain S-box protein [Streptosporangiales bacterium]
MSATSSASPDVRRPRHAAGASLRLVERLHEIVAGINAGLPLDDVLGRVCATAAELLDADLVAFLLADGDRWRPLVRRGGQDVERWAPVVVSPNDWVTQLVRDGEGWCAFPVDDVSPVVDGILRAGLPEAGAGMAVVARAPGQAAGALVTVYADATRTPRPAELDVLVLLAEHAGVAISAAHSSAEVARGRRHQGVLADATVDGLAVLDRTGRVLQWNRAAARLTGLTAEQVVGKPPPFPVSEPGQVVDHRLGGGRWLEVLSSAVPESDDLVVEFRDVSQEKELEHAKDAFLATVGHELRTPVTAIQGFSSTLLRRWHDLSDPGRQAAVEVVAERSAALAALVDKIVLGSAISLGQAEVTGEPVDLGRVLAEVLAERPAGDLRHDVILDVADTAPAALADPRSLTEIVTQLVDNAVKFSPDGGDVLVRAWDDGARVGISVIDHGIGVDPVDRDRVFELFYQSGTGDRRRFGGMGLGLYIVRQLVRSFGGEVAVYGMPGGGTEVRVSLVRAGAAQPMPWPSSCYVNDLTEGKDQPVLTEGKDRQDRCETEA